MTEQRSSDEEPIIELTEIVEASAAGDDDIIELTDVVDAIPPADEEIIELTEVVPSPPKEEEILELVDVVETTPPDETAAPEEDFVMAADAPVEMETAPEGLIEVDRAETVAPESAAFDLFAEAVPEETPEAAPDGAGQDDDLDFAPMDLDIEENKEDDLFDSLGMNLEPELQGAAGSDELDFNLSTQELSDAIDLLDAKLAEEPPAEGPDEAAQTAALPETITEAQFEKALENVIRKMFTEKIDVLINEAIEKTVSAEIENIKNQLLKDSTEE